MLGLIGRKIGMTQLFAEDGSVVPVTAIEAGPCPIVQVKTEERDGYRAVQIGYGRKKPRRSRRPDLGHAARAGLDYVPAIVREFRLGPDEPLAEDPHTPPQAAEAAPTNGAAEGDGGEAGESGAPASEGLRVGQVLTVSMFRVGERVKVTANTKGRGFQGVVKRHGFAGRPSSHGHPSVRVPGSIGPGTDPSRVIKGRKMAGRMGGKRKSIRNLTVVKVDPERNLLFVRGSVPGARNGWVLIGKD
jgi:large subunit ribosomal protein L3